VHSLPGKSIREKPEFGCKYHITKKREDTTLKTAMTETHDQHHLSASQTSAPSPAETLSPLEQEVLDEYARLLGNLNNVR
jgi:hypothetical protein